MTYLSDQNIPLGEEFLGVWEEPWRERAALAQSAERYKSWLRQQGYSRDEAAERTIRLLAANPPLHQRRPPTTDSTTIH